MGRLHALLLADADAIGPLSGDLSAAGFTVTGADPVDWTVDRLSAETGLVVIDDGQHREQRRHLLQAIKGHSPDMPVLWLANTAIPLRSFGDLPPDFVLARPLEADALWRVVADRLERPPYPPEFVPALQQTLQDGIAGAFGTAVSIHPLFIRATCLTDAPINALMPFSGKGLGGHLIVSGDAAGLTAVREHLITDRPPTQDDLQDLAGEIANLAVGRLKEQLIRLGYPIDLGLPVFVSGEPSRMRYRASGCNLVLWGQTPDKQLAIELCMEWLDLANMTPTDVAIADAGDLLFL